MKFTIVKRIGAVVALATTIAGGISLLILKQIIEMHDSLVRSRYNTLEKELLDITDDARYWINERKKYLLSISNNAFNFLDEIPNTNNLNYIFEILNKRYPEIKGIKIIPITQNNKKNHNYYRKNLVIPKNFKCKNITKKINKWGQVTLNLCMDDKPLKLHTIISNSIQRAKAMDRIQSELIPYYYLIVSIGAIGGALLSIFASWLLVRRMVQEISELSYAAREIAKGNVSVRVRARGDDELGEFEREFNRMVEELENSRKKIRYLERMGAWQEVARRLAHEIKNPLTPIVLMIDQVLEKTPNEPASYKRLVETAAKVIKSEVDMLRELVETFGQLAKLPQPKIKPFNINELLQEIKEVYTTMGQVKIQLKLNDKNPIIKGDRLLLKRVISNIIDNSIEAGADIITIYYKRENNKFFIFIQDNGIGIKNDIIDKIFEPYYTTKKHGTGLGLALVRKVALDHDGDVGVINNTDGTTIYLWLKD